MLTGGEEIGAPILLRPLRTEKVQGGSPRGPGRRDTLGVSALPWLASQGRGRYEGPGRMRATLCLSP